MKVARGMFAAATLIAGAHVATAQAPAPLPRNGGEYGGLSHDPTQAEVSERERKAGDALPPGRAREDTRSVEDLGRQLLDAERASPPRAADLPAASPSRP